jgi:hypothetical protein
VTAAAPLFALAAGVSLVLLMRTVAWVRRQ